MQTLYVLKETFTNGYYISMVDVLTLIAIFTSISVIVSKNPIVSVLFLIGLFLCVACYLIILGISFIGLSYLLVYVGAVSILFLFILMLINIRMSELLSETKNSIPLVFILAWSFSLPLSEALPFNVTSNYNETFNLLTSFFSTIKNNVNYVTVNTWDGNLMETSHITSIGNIMYTSHAIWLIITSIILLLAMVGAIVITLKDKHS